jgi:diguanylate cyclase (GGDEF)-like protein
MKNWRLKHRILFIATAPVWLITMLLMLGVVIIGTTQIDDKLKMRGSLITHQLAPASEYGAFSGNREVLQALTLSVIKEEDAKAVLITDPRGKALAISGKPSKFTLEHVKAAMSNEPFIGENHTMIFGAPIYQGDTEVDGLDLLERSNVNTSTDPKLLGYVYVEMSTASTRSTKILLMVGSVIIGMIGMALASWLAMRMGRQISEPLSQLLIGVNQMAKGKLDVRIDAGATGEIGELEKGFNSMAEKLQFGHKKMQMTNADLEQLVTLRTKELMERNHDLERLSMTDRLTGLYNRLKLDQILDEEYARSLRYGSGFGIALIDVDKFKSVNDTYGHQVGDQVLIAFANVLSQNLRGIDVVGRWGGEEFLLICRATDLYGTIATAEKLRQAVADHVFRTIGTRTASFGVAAYQPGDIIVDIIARADTALYRAKENGRNRLEYENN